MDGESSKIADPEPSGTINDVPKVDVDTMLAYAGDFGRYQVLLMALFCLINFLSSFHYFAQTFITVEPDFECAIMEVDNLTDILTAEQLNKILHPKSKCKRYEVNLTEIITADTRIQVSSLHLKSCKKFKYNREYDYESIVSELDWVCSNSWKPALGQSLYFAGAVVGTFFLGILADQWGRIKALIIAYILSLIGNVMTAFSYELEIFAASRFIAGLATDTNFVMMYIIVMEYIRPSMRTFGLNICIGVFYCLGCVAIPWVAVAFQSWRTFLLGISAAMVLVPFYYLILPESASWLLTHGSTEKALAGFLKIAKINRKVIPDNIIRQFRETYKDGVKPPQPNLCGPFRTPKLRRKMCILIFKTMTLTLCYDAILRNVQVKGVSPFVVFSLGSLAIFPASLIILAFQDRIGRKGLFFIFVLTSAIFTALSGLLYMFLRNTSPATGIGLSMAARLCVIVAFNSGSQYAAELIPTIIRARGVALIHVVGYAAGFGSPILLWLSTFWRPLPDLILGFLCLVCAMSTLLLPETLGKTLPVTLEDGENFGENENPCDFVCCGKGRCRS